MHGVYDFISLALPLEIALEFLPLILRFCHLLPLVFVLEVSLARRGIVCGEFWDGNFRDSETSQTKTNGEATKGRTRKRSGPRVAQRKCNSGHENRKGGNQVCLGFVQDVLDGSKRQTDPALFWLDSTLTCCS